MNVKPILLTMSRENTVPTVGMESARVLKDVVLPFPLVMKMAYVRPPQIAVAYTAQKTVMTNKFNYGSDPRLEKRARKDQSSK